MPGVGLVVVARGDALGAEPDLVQDTGLLRDPLEVAFDLTLEREERGPVAVGETVRVQMTGGVHAAARIVVRVPDTTGLILLLDDRVLDPGLPEPERRGDAGHTGADDQHLEAF